MVCSCNNSPHIQLSDFLIRLNNVIYIFHCIRVKRVTRNRTVERRLSRLFSPGPFFHEYWLVAKMIHRTHTETVYLMSLSYMYFWALKAFTALESTAHFQSVKFSWILTYNYVYLVCCELALHDWLVMWTWYTNTHGSLY